MTNPSLANKETGSPAEQKTNKEPNAEEMPSGRTRRRRSAIS
jgi:ribonuclease J